MIPSCLPFAEKMASIATVEIKRMRERERTIPTEGVARARMMELKLMTLMARRRKRRRNVPMMGRKSVLLRHPN